MHPPAAHAELTAAAASRRPGRWRRHLPWIAAYLAVVAVALFLLWPVPRGEMVFSADHPVHLARGSLYLEQLSRLHLTGWSPHWYFGFPLGDLYPPLGDLLLAAVYSLCGGLLTLPQAYALTFTLAYVGHALALVRAAALLGAGPVTAAFAGLLLLVDPGAIREGGWVFTVKYGVWFQPLACSLTWWGLAAVSRALDHGAAPRIVGARLAPAALLLGAAFLTHPIALPMIAGGLPLLAVILGLRSRLGLGRALVAGGLTGGLAFATAAWWVVPLLGHRHWMSSYGQLFSSLSHASKLLRYGRWSSNMLVSVGILAGVGLLYGLLQRRHRGLRWLAFVTPLLYLAAFSDVFFALRFDWLSPSLRNIQFQRFIVCAKPGLFLAAALAITLPWTLVTRRWPQPWRRRDRGVQALAVTAALASAALTWKVAEDAWERGKRHHVGEIRDSRGDDTLDADILAFGAWARERWESRDRFYRIALRTPRHSHILVDSILWSRTPTYKIGFTPGETFAHKPESGNAELLRRLRVRYSVNIDDWRSHTAPEVVRIGEIKVWDYSFDRDNAVAEVEGPGTVEVLAEDYDAGRVQIRLSGAEPGSRLVFNIAGYPRWQLFHGDREIEWVEAPALGEGPVATQAMRRAGLLRESRPGAPSSREPMLLAVEGAEDGVYTLRYRRWRGVDIIGFGLTGLGLALLALLRCRRSAGALDDLLEGAGRRLGHPLVLGLLAAALVVGVSLRYAAGYARERETAVGWVYAGDAGEDADGAAPGPVKVARVIEPAIVFKPSGGYKAWIVLPNIDVPPAVDGERPPIVGWYATADETYARRKSLAKGLVLEAALRPAGQDVPFTPTKRQRIHKAWGKKTLEIATDGQPDGPVDLLLTLHRAVDPEDLAVIEEPDRPYVLGVNLDLGLPAENP